MHIDYSLLGKRLASTRKERNLTQEKLAEMTNLANNYISNIENSRSIPSLETLVKLCEALEITPNDLLTGASEQSEYYMDKDIAVNLQHCTPKEKRLISGFISLLLEERKN